MTDENAILFSDVPVHKRLRKLKRIKKKKIGMAT